MEYLTLNQVTIESVAKIVSKDIKDGKIVIIPTDTAYAISADATNEESVRKIYNIKNREQTNPIHICVHSINMAKEYAEISEQQEEILNYFLPGAYTFILKKKSDKLPSLLTAGLDTIGIRIPGTDFTSVLGNYLDVPFTATSANLSGMNTAYTMKDIKEQYGDENLSDYFSAVVDSERKLIGNISTIIDIIDVYKPVVLREGVIKKQDVIKKIEEIIK